MFALLITDVFWSLHAVDPCATSGLFFMLWTDKCDECSSFFLILRDWATCLTTEHIYHGKGGVLVCKYSLNIFPQNMIKFLPETPDHSPKYDQISSQNTAPFPKIWSNFFPNTGPFPKIWSNFFPKHRTVLQNMIKFLPETVRKILRNFFLFLFFFQFKNFLFYVWKPSKIARENQRVSIEIKVGVVWRGKVAWWRIFWWIFPAGGEFLHFTS